MHKDENHCQLPAYHVIEVDPDKFSKAGRIVVADSLGVPIGFQNWVCVHNPVLQIGLFWAIIGWPVLLLFPFRGAKYGEVGDHLLGVLRLASSGLAGDQHALVLRVVHHLRVRPVGGGKEVRRHLRGCFYQVFKLTPHLVSPFPDIHLASPVGVDGEPLVGVDHHAEEARVGLVKKFEEL